MSFLSGAVHVIGDVAAPVVKYAGYASGSQKLSDIGASIANPSLHLSNPGGIVSSQPAFTPVLNAQKLSPGGTKSSTGQTPNYQTNTTNGSYGLSGSGAGGYGNGYSTTYGTQNPDAINAAYNIASNWYQGLLGQLDPQANQQYGDIDRQYGTNLGSITHQRDAALQDLSNQKDVLNDQYSKGLTQLGNQVRTQLQGGENALGVGGAGDSSAAQMLAYALSNLHNQQRGYMNQDLNHQMTAIGSTQTADNNQFEDAAKQLNDWKVGQYHSIAQAFNNLRQNIETSLASNEQARQNALNYANQWAAGQTAAVNQTLQDNLNDLANRQANGPNVGLSNLPTYQSQNINPGTLPVSSDLSNPVTPQDVLQVANPLLDKKDQQDPLNPAF